MTNTKALILGGNGFIGSNLCSYLLNKGLEVYSFDITYPPVINKEIHYIKGDFFDDETLLDSVKGKDVIYHAVSTIIPGNSNETYMNGYSRDFIQTIKLIESIKDTNTKLIFLSSGGTIYGHQDIQPINENAYGQPINHYGNVKLCIENTIRIFNLYNKNKTIIARVANPYGPGQDYHKGVGFIDAAIKNVIINNPIEIWGDGNIVRDYIYITDVCKMLYCLSTYTGSDTIFNISSNEGTSQNQIVDIINTLIGSEKVSVVYKEARNIDVPTVILDNSRITERFPCKLISIQEGIEMYYNYILENYNRNQNGN